MQFEYARIQTHRVVTVIIELGIATVEELGLIQTHIADDVSIPKVVWEQTTGETGIKTLLRTCIIGASYPSNRSLSSIKIILLPL